MNIKIMKRCSVGTSMAPISTLLKPAVLVETL